MTFSFLGQSVHTALDILMLLMSLLLSGVTSAMLDRSK